MKKVKLELSISEAVELLMVAGNGYGDSEYYTAGSRGRGFQSQHKAYLRADKKAWEAVRQARMRKEKS